MNDGIILPAWHGRPRSQNPCGIRLRQKSKRRSLRSSRSTKSVLAKLEARVNDLENRLKLNSTNSSKPPSSDPIGMKRKPPAPPSGKKRGGQPGHRKAYRDLGPAREDPRDDLTASRPLVADAAMDSPATTPNP